MHIKTFLIKITISLLLIFNVSAHDHVPHALKSDDLNIFPELRVFKNLSTRHKLVGYLFHRKEYDRSIQGGQLSLRRKVSRKVQYGIEADATSGVRHDDDWIWNKKTNEWEWEDAEQFEFSSNLFVKLKTQLTFLPGSNWIGELNMKTRNNWSESLLTLIPTLKLTYIHFSGGKAKYNFYIKGNNYIPLNYSTEDIYKKWYYVGFMYHLTARYKPYIFYSLQEVTWTRSKEFKQSLPEENYKHTGKNSYLGLGLNIYL